MTKRHIQRKVAFCQGGCSAMMFATTRPAVTCKPCHNKQRRAAGRKPSSQKFTTCLSGCGASVSYKTNDRVYCPDCRDARKRDAGRRSAEKRRRQMGVRKVKGTTINCERCGDAFVRNGIRAKFCKPCAEVVALERARATSVAKAATKAGREYNREWHRERSRTCPTWCLNNHMRVMMHRALGKNKAGRSWRSFVPYTIDDLMRHLERQFAPGMTWENRGEWHIDHIVPRSSFNITGPDCPEFKAAWSLSNLRPLWAKDNIRKNATRTHLI